ncbi:LysR family transcriptional regulator [Rhizobacter sp. Root1221]|uniref:LysR family transcriptional regulator n=1 Tax=Rhizobacter sp. Root1221 TaxID=1736433 RepID=UPI0006FEF960|nr:LysR family transcriptional regulator [Rhizobacter sp. Root1221]KQW00149.1 hypothetical protein ASC87_19240 [Rhizobacter sp. Root1221]
MDQLRALRLFSKVAVLGSFQRVAVDEGITAQAVGKSIRQLEDHLGVRVLHRTTRRCSLTQEGQSLLDLTRTPLDELARALNIVNATSLQVVGPLRVSAAPSARAVLAEPIARFCERHPRVRIELVTANAFTDTVDQQVDVGFRSGHQPRGDLVARRLFAVRQRLCAAPSYLARHGTPDSIEALRQHRCTGFRDSQSGKLWPWDLPGAGAFDPDPVFCTNDPESEVALVRAGMGIGLLDDITAAGDLQAGRLVVVLPEVRPADLGFHMYYPSRKRLPQRTRAFIDFMAAQLSDTA